MKETFDLFRKSVSLVWKSAPGWTSTNIVISSLRSFMPLLLIWLLRILIDSVTQAATPASDVSFNEVIWLILAVIMVFFIDEAASDISNYVRKKQSLKLENYMYGLLHSKAVRLDLINFERPEYFDNLTRASREAPWRPNSILNNLVAMLRGFLSLLLMAGVITTLHWALALLLVMANIPAIWLRLHYADILYNFQRRQTPEARRSAYYNWLLTGDRPSRELRLFGLGDYFMSLFRRSFTRQKEEELEIIRKRTTIELISNLFKATAFFITLYVIARQTISGDISLGLMAMFLLAFRQGMVYIKELLRSMAALYEDNLFVRDTFEFLNLREKVTAREPVITTPPLKKMISVENISFTYPGNNFRTIDNISFRIEKNEIVALVGPNGAGKSTLVRLLCRLYDPDSGTIRLDDNDISHFDPEEYRRLFSVMFQDFMLYNLTAGENIRMGDIQERGADEKIINAAAGAGIHKMITGLPKGYDTHIGNLFDESRGLSWGEWQKLALARALFRDAPLLILDEPVSALDAATEYDIFNRFREMVKGRTSILISHRFTNVSLADRIIVLDKGKIAETGTHDSLMTMNGLYAKMYSMQNSRRGK